MKKDNAYMIYNVDREDYWLIGQVVFPCKNTDTYEDAFNELKEKLSSPEVVDFIIDDNCLIDDLFEQDETYKFKEVKRKHYGLVYVFENSEGDEVEKEFKEEFTRIF